MATIVEVLKNAEYNLTHPIGSLSFTVAVHQLHNAIVLIEKGYKLETDVDDLLDFYDDNIDAIPEAWVLDKENGLL